ncbi:DUF3617 domain-containing protein [Asticcacaulis solisilvae]|uniref:DUF3617 domain-containing protein n=1 Tax=Asticcacaulis solisilvae TaxID=1217274 RepID=UPI003FD76B3E
MTFPALACLAIVLAPVLAHAQTVPAKPGLWASASQAVLNGKTLPTIFDIHGVPEAKKTQLRQAMAQAGLPAGWNPSLTCETATRIDLQTILGQMKAEGCTPEVTSNSGSRITGKVTCASGPTTGTGTVEVSGIGSAQVTYVLNMTGTISGAPMTYKATTVSKFIGSDCSQLPPGVDADMLSGQ